MILLDFLKGTGHLLIVPYGIETSERMHWYREFILLIVPYGIETSIVCVSCCKLPAFNRTLWN